MTSHNHRPRPFTTVMYQTWHHLLFAHWRVSVEALNRLLPVPLRAHTYEGEAWVAVVPFKMSGVRLRGLPPIPLTHTLLELNVRTYVMLDDEPGVYFFSLDASNPLAVEVARRWFRLAYFNAGMTMNADGGTVHYAAHRTDNRARTALFAARYRGVGKPYHSTPDTLEHWLTERYALYAAPGDGSVYRGRIHHEPWGLQRAEAVFEFNDVAQSHGIELPDEAPLLHYIERLDIRAGAIERVR